ncbi:transmembrane protein 214 isoform X3 [Gopherus flavomarginatus]|uniref:transmembrane protein 214 isoform X3 n=1 Tax=Gopherus flavomarginatus TaxID=286002 RepID=UPI0021CBA54A|nr:transmembrane protein 214 isoform X3 [Gopherus flavomarginatus]
MASVGPAGAGRWELVRRGRGRRPAGGAAGRRALQEANSGRLLPSASPIATSDTIFELGFEKTLKKQNKEQVPPAPAPEQHHKKQNMGKNAKKSTAVDAGLKQGKFRTLEDALKALDLTELQKELDKSQNVFPENPSVWVKDLAGYLNYKLQTPRSDPTLSQHTPGESLHGYRICVQAVVLDKPKIATVNLGKYLELLRSHQNRPMKCLTIMWALGQAGFTDLTEGLKVWLGIMLPVLGIKSLSPYAIAYLDRLLMTHANLTKGFGMIGPKDFFPLLDFAFMPNNSLSPSLQEQLRQLYPRLKVLAFGAKRETTLHTYFPSFLSRATPNCPADMRNELLICLSECLSMDALSFSVWRQLYTKHLSQSSLLLNHLLESWDSTSRKVRKSLQETVRSFKVTNEELAVKGPNSLQDLAACHATCKNLLQKMKGRGFPWVRLLLVVLVFAAGFLVHDIRTQGSFQASSAHILRSSGILSVSQQAWNKVSHYSLEGYSWLERNVPVYYSQVLTVLGPNLKLVWTKTNETAVYVSGKCSSQISWVKDNLPWFIEWLQARVPDFVLHVAECIKELFLFLLQNCLLPALESVGTALERGWELCVEACNGEVSWDCMRKHLTSFTYSSWLYLQNTTLAIKNWALAMISGH